MNTVFENMTDFFYAPCGFAPSRCGLVDGLSMIRLSIILINPCFITCLQLERFADFGDLGRQVWIIK
jgi:hypothetical protein